MHSGFRYIPAVFFTCIVILALRSHLFSQEPSPGQAIAAAELPQSPQPQFEVEASGLVALQAPAAPGQPAPPPAQNTAAQGGSSLQTGVQQPGTEKSQHEKAEEQIREQEHQRLAGIVPLFNVTYHNDAVSLTPAEKFKLQFRAAIDPYTFSMAVIVAGLGEANDSNTGFGWGPGGFAKRAAAAYGDNVIGNTFGNAVLPSILHQDPRYFRLGHGSFRHRVLYSFATAFICKHDNTGKWEPNYSNVLGNMIGGEISNFYSPGGSSNLVHTLGTGMTVTLEGAFGSELLEFWPDVSRKFFHKDPTHGLDAQARAQDAAAKQKKQQEETHK
jgi:hypothetical protein